MTGVSFAGLDLLATAVVVLDDELRVRFANAASANDRDRDIRGMSIRVSDVAGENLTPGATCMDFVLNSHPVMMVPGAREFLELLQANEEGGLRRALYFLRHPKATAVALASRGNPSCHLDIPYWSATPYAFGPGRAVKYVAMPTSASKSPMPDPAWSPSFRPLDPP